MTDRLEWGPRPRRVSVVVDTPGWFDPFAEALVAALNAAGDEAVFARSHAEVQQGEVAFYLSCLRITPPDVLARNRFNLVVHASNLPRDRGFSPVVWQVLEGAGRIPICMIEAAEPVDSGPIVRRAEIVLAGHELNDEIRRLLGDAIVRMCLDHLAAAGPAPGAAQSGEPSWRPRRGPADSRLHPDRTLTEQFDLLRVVDNDRYPAFFDLRGRRYRLRIEDAGPAGED